MSSLLLIEREREFIRWISQLTIDAIQGDSQNSVPFYGSPRQDSSLLTADNDRERLTLKIVE